MKSHSLHDLHTLFASVKNEKEAQLLLDDILTPAELASITERWQLVQALASGMTQRDIKKKYKISISKITRGSHMLKRGSGGFGLFLQRLGKLKRKAP
ncbi:transcriptional regulator [Candidatus Peribacteria bacterium]|nr:transcriptional regulator [Candidatus Peribacteria bacterium]